MIDAHQALEPHYAAVTFQSLDFPILLNIPAPDSIFVRREICIDGSDKTDHNQQVLKVPPPLFTVFDSDYG